MVVRVRPPLSPAARFSVSGVRGSLLGPGDTEDGGFATHYLLSCLDISQLE